MQQRGGARPKNLPLTRTQQILENSRQKTETNKISTVKKREAEKQIKKKTETASIASSLETQVSDTALSIQSGVSSFGPTPHGFDKTREYEKESDNPLPLPQLRSLLKPIAEIGQDLKVRNPSTIQLLYSNFNVSSSRISYQR